jgi:hypothetical protein
MSITYLLYVVVSYKDIVYVNHFARTHKHA